MQEKKSLKTRLLPVTGIMVALAISLLMLVTIGYRDALVAYTGYEFDKLGAQGDVIRQSMKPFLLNGLPLEQFPGFQPLTTPLLESDSDLQAIYIQNEAGDLLFINARGANSFDPGANVFEASPTITSEAGSTYIASENEAFLRASLPLEGKFGPSGELHLIYDHQATITAVNTAYQPVWLIALILWVLVFPLALRFSGSERVKSTRWMQTLFGSVFVLAAAFVISIMLTIYTTGVNRKADALTHSLAQRLAVPFELGLDMTLFSGLEEVIESYRSLDPDIGFIALSSGDETTISAGARSEQEGYVEHTFLITPDGGTDTKLDVQLGIPLSVVYASLFRGVRNFLILFFATVFLANLIFSLNQTLQDKLLASARNIDPQNLHLNIIRPFYFLIVFAEGLHASFLPQFLDQWAVDSGFDPSVTSTIFTLYFLGFVAALLPSGWLIGKLGIRKTLIIGSVIYAVSMIVLAVTPLFWTMFPIRFLGGIGQGILYIAVQGYILEVARDNKTQAAAIIVFGYNGGMISGTAIGALIAVYLSFSGVFMVGAAIALLFLIYVFALIPTITISEDEQSEDAVSETMFQRFKHVGRDWRFIKTMLLIGIPTKAVLTGVTVFALPIILSDLRYRQDDIGMILMLYAAGVLLSSRFAARWVDGGAKVSRILLFGAIGGGTGLVLMGQIDADWVLATGMSNLGMYVLMGGILILGLAHGFIHAPIVTYIADTVSAEKLGKSSATSLYRFLER
ncbi:MAG: MFS transporter, partial [Chloroflexota bacterium]